MDYWSEWCGENPGKWVGGRIRCTDRCPNPKCGYKETYNLDGN
jgi:hypothetical protein